MLSKNLTVVNPSGLHLRHLNFIAVWEEENHRKECIKRNGSRHQVRH